MLLLDSEWKMQYTWINTPNSGFLMIVVSSLTDSPSNSSTTIYTTIREGFSVMATKTRFQDNSAWKIMICNGHEGICIKTPISNQFKITWQSLSFLSGWYIQGIHLYGRDILKWCESKDGVCHFWANELENATIFRKIHLRSAFHS